MSPCLSTEQLRDLLAECLTPAERTAACRHIDGCEACQRALDGLIGEEARLLPRHAAAEERGHEPLAPPLRQLLAGSGRPPPDLRTTSIGAITTEFSPLGLPVDPRAPLSLADFELQQRIGTGGAGAVYRAVQRSLNKPVAIKVHEPTDRPDEIARFVREACSAARLRHPNIVDVHGIGRTPSGGYFLVMDLVPGRNLEEIVRAGRLSDERIAEVVAAIADAVHYGHEQGVIHRDLKPANVLLADDGRVLVTDFGIAKVAGDDNLTRRDCAVGTPRYMAPEQADSTWGQVGAWTDVYGLGGILYFLLAAQHPHAGAEGPLAVLARVVSDQPPVRPSEIGSDVSPELERICLRCLHKRPEARFASAREVAEALRDVRRTGSPSYGAESAIDGLGRPSYGAIPLDSQFYLVRAADAQFAAAIARRDSIVLVRGARQMGKTSLVARGLNQARESGTRVVLTDFQKLNASDLESAETLFLTLGDWLADRLDLDVSPHDTWQSRRGASVNFERFLRREILGKLQSPLVWGLDEADRIFTCPFSSEVFGLFRSWHNERALDPTGPWAMLTLVIAYATEAHLFITDLNQSPFNVGTRLSLADFTPEQVAELDSRYGRPLRGELSAFIDLVGGQPYLVNRGLYEMAARGWDVARFAASAGTDDGLFGDHLRRIVVLLAQDEPLREAVCGVLTNRTSPSSDAYYRLTSAGVLTGPSPRECRLRCGLYETYLRQRLL